MAKGNIMNFTFKSTVELQIQQVEGGTSSKELGAAVEFDVEGDIDETAFFDENKMTKMGMRALSHTLVRGLGANIHKCHQSGDWDSAEHLRYIISELEKIFVSPNIRTIEDDTSDQAQA